MVGKGNSVLDLYMHDNVINTYNPTFWREARVRHFRYRYFTVSQLMHFDVHLGGNERDIIETSYWFLYGRRKGFVFIDLHPTILILRRLILVITEVIKNFGKFMFVDSDRQYCWGTQRLAMQVGEAYCIYSWVGGLLTNFKKIWAFYNVALRYTDWGLLRRPKARLKFILQGLDALYGPPSLIFINRLEHGHNAAAESHAVCIPSIGLVDLNTYSNEATYLIPSNDDSKRTVSYFNQLITRAVMKSKLHRALSFIRRKNFREQKGNTILEYRLMDMRKMFDVYKSLETRHTVHYRMPLRDWAALRKARTVFLGFPIPYLSTKTAISFIFRRLKREYFIDKERLNTLRKLKQKASFIYKRYYAQFFNIKPRLEVFRDIDNKEKLKKEFFSVTLKKHHKRFPVKVLDILQKVRWLFDVRNKYKHLSLWLKWRMYNLYKSAVIEDKERLKKLSRFYKFFYKEYSKLNKLYTYFIRRHYKPLHVFFSTWRERLDTSRRFVNEKEDLGETFNKWYFGGKYYNTNIKKDAYHVWQRLLLKYDLKKRREERSKNLKDFKLSRVPNKHLPYGNKRNLKMNIYNIDRMSKNQGIKRKTSVSKRSNRSLRYNNPYSWKFRRLWKPRRISHFFKLNPYYLALLRNRPWFPMREIVRFQLEEPTNSNQFVLKHESIYNLMKGNLNFFLKDRRFATGKDFLSFHKRVSFEFDFIYFPKRLLRSRSVDYFSPVSVSDIIPRDLHWYYSYWNLKLDPKQFLSYFKLIHTRKEDFSTLTDSQKFLYNFYQSVLKTGKTKEELQQEKEERWNKDVKSSLTFAKWKEIIYKKHQSSFYYTFVANNPQLGALYNKPVSLYQQQILNRSSLFLDFYNEMLKSSDREISMNRSENKPDKYFTSFRTQSRLKMLQTFSDKVEWASDYYELLNYNRRHIQSYSSFFDTDKINENDLMYNRWNLITHLNRYQKTPSFLNLFILGRVKTNFREARIKSPYLRRLKRKIDWKKQQQYGTKSLKRIHELNEVRQSSNYKQNKVYRHKKGHFKPMLSNKSRLGRVSRYSRSKDKRKIGSSYHLAKKQQRLDSLKKLFPFYFWLRWYKGVDLLNLFQKDMVYSYLLLLNKSILRFKYAKEMSNKVIILKQLFSLFKAILNLLVYKTNNTSVLNILVKLKTELNIKTEARSLEDTITYFTRLLKEINQTSYAKKPSKHSKFMSLSYLWRWFYKNTAKAYFMPTPILASKNVTLIDLYHRKSVFFNKHGFTFLKDDIFNKVGLFYGKRDQYAFNKSHYDYLAGIPANTAQRIFMKMRSRFNYNKYQKFFWLKLSQRFKGRVFLEALFNDFKYGKVKSQRHYRMIREVVYRLHRINKQRHSIFVEMFQNNPYVDRPHLKANVDKYSGSHLFLLKNYGAKRFLRKRKFDTLDVFYFMRWFLRHKKSVPTNLRRRFMFLFRMWNNKSMFLSS